MTCARCHSHKYDAIRQAEYYQLFAFFNNGQEANAKLPVSNEATKQYAKQKADYDAKLKALDGQIASSRTGHVAAFDTWKKKIQVQIRMMTGQEAGSVAPKEVAPIFAIALHKRNAKQSAQLLDYFFKNEYAATKKLIADREALQKIAPKEPVTVVRVLAEQNRQTRIMERGDFLNVTDEVHAAGLSVLPPIDGRKENVRDRLDLAHWLMSESNPLTPRVLANQVWEKLFGEGLVRTMNDFGVRGDPPTHPDLIDWLGAEYRRMGWSRKKMIETIVMSSTYRQASAHRMELLETDPTNKWLARQNIQALTMLNNEVFIEASQAFAKRALELAASDDHDRIAQALRICIGRQPADSEIARFVKLLEKSRAYYQQNLENAKKVTGGYLPQEVEPAEAAAWVAQKVWPVRDGFFRSHAACRQLCRRSADGAVAPLRAV